MTPQEFAYWLQGFAELGGDNPPTKAQWKSIREHLALVFVKVTPPVQIPNRSPLKDWVPNTGNPPQRPLFVECVSGELNPATTQAYC